MNKRVIKEVKDECKRLLKRIEELEKLKKRVRKTYNCDTQEFEDQGETEFSWALMFGSKETAAVKRASMDLTRVFGRS